MTDTTLAARIRALAETGTWGPWHVCDRHDDDWADFTITRADHGTIAGLTEDSYLLGKGWPTAEGDAALIVAAVNALPALADLVEVVESRHWLQHGRDCAECGDEWPCPTMTALDALAVALGVEP